MILLRQLQVTGIVTGECSSAALWPFAACRRRIVTPFSVLLFHPMKWQSEEHVGLAEADLPTIYFAGGITTIFTAQVIGWLADRFGKRRVFTVLAFISIVPILLQTHLPPLPLHYVIVVVVCFFIFVPGRFGPAMALVSGSVEARLRGSFMSFNSAVQQLASGCAALVAGLIVGRAADGSLTHYNWAGWVSVACTLLAIILVQRIQVVPETRHE